MAFTIISNSHVLAQKKEKANSPFGIEVDPIAYIFNGYSLHGIYQTTGCWSFDVGVFGILEPEFYSSNKGFETIHKGVGAKVHYHLQGKDTKGFYVGLGNGYSTMGATNKESKTKVIGYSWSAGIHTGYRFFMFNNNNSRGLYLTPWVSRS